MKVFVLGARGMLGSEFIAALREANADVRGADIDELDITKRDAVIAFLHAYRPEVVVNCAAYTAVDRAEREPDLAMAVNGTGPANVAQVAREIGAVLVHFSTDFVFDGKKKAPYLPDDHPNPLNCYGRSKLAGEDAVRQIGGEHLLIRTSWLYGKGGANFVSAILRQATLGVPLRVVRDQVGRPTWARNLAAVTLDLLQEGARGVFHAADAGSTTWLGLAQEALSIRGISLPIEGVSTSEWGAPALRPSYSVLDTSSTESVLGRELEPWRHALARFLTE